MGISVIIRNKNDVNIERCISSFENVDQKKYEIILIDSSDKPMDFKKFHVIILYEYRNVSRSEALIIGISMAKYEKILIIDSDQIVSSQLMDQLDSIKNDMCVIQEKSLNRNFIGKLTDFHREFLYLYSKQFISETLPVIPRLYRRSLFNTVIARIGVKQLSRISQHEDSIIFSEALKISTDISFCDVSLLNTDPSFAEFARKSFRYGLLQARALSSDDVSPERKQLLRSIDRNRIIYLRKVAFNIVIMYDFIKAFFYIPGLVVGKFSEVL